MKFLLRSVMTVVLLLAPLSAPPVFGQTKVEIVKVYDGDTVSLRDGSRIRLVQIDAPEMAGGECYSRQSRDLLASLIKSKTITFVTDPNLDQVDKYGRKLGYLFAGKMNINLKLVELGAATPYFYRGEKGKYSSTLSMLAIKAQSGFKGLWKSCPGTKLNEYSAITTVAKKSKISSLGCDPNYSGCVPQSSVDLDCADIRKLGLAPIRIIGVDIHRLDQDGNGYGCE